MTFVMSLCDAFHLRHDMWLWNNGLMKETGTARTENTYLRNEETKMSEIIKVDGLVKRYKELVADATSSFISKSSL